MAAGSVPTYISDLRIVSNGQHRYVSRQGQMIGAIWLLASAGIAALLFWARSTGNAPNPTPAMFAIGVTLIISAIGFGIRREVLIDSNSCSLKIFKGFYKLSQVEKEGLTDSTSVVVQATPSGPGKYQIAIVHKTQSLSVVCACKNLQEANDWARELAGLINVTVEAVK